MKKPRRVTIYDIAREVGIAPSSVSKALNDLPSISDKVKTLVKATAKELNYKHNSNAAGLRRGTSRTIGVIVPKINVAFFSDAIAGMEEVCYENNHSLIICQSDESYAKEVQSVETLIRQNVDCIMISLSQETKVARHLQEISHHNMPLIQFDRVDHQFNSHTVVNDNKTSAYHAVKHLLNQGYTKIAFMGGPDHLAVYKERKEGFIQSIEEAALDLPYYYILHEALTAEAARQAAVKLLGHKNPPDAFFTVSDHAALGVLKAAKSLKLRVPEDLGIVGFSNEKFTEVTYPTLSSIDQKGKQMGRAVAEIYFNYLLARDAGTAIADVGFHHHTIEGALMIRESSSRKMVAS